jgi:hypothetical protein
MGLNPFRKGTQLHAISEMLLEGMSREDIFRRIYPLIGTDPFVWSDNVNGSRIPKPLHDQIPLAFYTVGRARVSLLEKSPDAAAMLADEDSTSARNYASKSWRARLYNEIRRENEGTVAVDPTPDPDPIYSEPNTLQEKIEYLYRRLVELRNFVQSKKTGGREFDYISTRAFVHGRNAVLQGIEPDDFLWSIGANWSDDVKSAAGLNYAVDYKRYSVEGTPLLLGFVVRLMLAGIPVYLYGPTGSGKSVLASKIAEFLELPYGEIALSLGVSRTDLFGNWNAKGFVNRPFTEMYKDSGVFCFEEIDAADPNILLAVNNAVANNTLFNSSNGEETRRNERFYPIATANTLGNGATANFGGREGLDGSTLDRFKYGRVFVDYNTELEHDLMFSNLPTEIVNPVA